MHGINEMNLLEDIRSTLAQRKRPKLDKKVAAYFAAYDESELKSLEYSLSRDWQHITSQDLEQNSEVFFHFTSDAFGYYIPALMTMVKQETTLSLRLPGQYLDAETGTHYNYQRYYDPSTGRYQTSD